MFDELFEQALSIFHQEKPGLPQPGDVIAHPSDDFTYTVYSTDQKTIRAFYIDDENKQKIVKDFPVGDVFNPGVVLAIIQRLQSQMN